MEPPETTDQAAAGEGAGLSARARTIYQRLRLVAQLLRDAPCAEGPRLLWRDEEGAARSCRIAEALLIGRDETCNIVLSSSAVSRRHCRVTYRNGSVWLEDLDSTHGTRVNGTGCKEASLTDGDLIEVGGMVLACILSDDPA